MAIRDVSRILQNTPHKSQIPVIKWSTNKMLGILIEKLRDFHLVKKFQPFMELEISLPCSRVRHLDPTLARLIQSASSHFI
jgi:hypothetical protein